MPQVLPCRTLCAWVSWFGLWCLLGITVHASGLRVEVTDGWLTAGDASENVLLPGAGYAVDLSINGHWALADRQPTVQVYKGPDMFSVEYTTTEGVLTDVWRRRSGLVDGWTRTATWKNTSSERQDLVDVYLRIHPARFRTSDAWRSQPFWMRRASSRRLVCVSYHTRRDPWAVHTEAQFAGIKVSAAWRLSPGQSAQVGEMGVWMPLYRSGDCMRDEAQRWYRAIGLRTTTRVPSWFPGAILYKTSGGGTIQSRNSDVGGYARLAHQTSYLADLGVSAVLLHSVHQHKSGPDPVAGGWNVYGVQDYDRVDVISGGEVGLQELTHQIRRNGMGVLIELALNGYFSHQAAALREWWSCAQDGKPVLHFGGASMDYASPEWQRIMADCAEQQVRMFGSSGGRLDLGAGSGPNWCSPVSNHASFSDFGASLQMLAALAQRARDAGATPVYIAEDLADRPERLRDTPLLYGFDRKQLLSTGLPAQLSDAATIVQRLRAFYETERGALPTGGFSLSTLGGLNEVVNFGKPSTRFGWGLSRALYGVMLIVPGIVQMVQEEEVGSFEAIRAMNWARRRVPELWGDAVNYVGVKCPDEVFAALRTAHGNHAVGLVNLSGRRLSAPVLLPVPFNGDAFDAVNGDRIPVRSSRFVCEMAPYQVRILRLGRPPVGQIPPQRWQGDEETAPAGIDVNELLVSDDGLGVALQGLGLDRVSTGIWRGDAGVLTVARTADGWRLKGALTPGAGWFALHVTGARRWIVSARTALLDDRLIRRHYPWPVETGYTWSRSMVWGREAQGMIYNSVYPTGRLWQSAIEPLHPTGPAVACQTASGRWLVIDQIRFAGRNVVLTDRTDETQVEPYGLSLRFYPEDADLSPRFRQFGTDQTWMITGSEPAMAGPVQVNLRVRLLDALTDAFTRDRLPVAVSRYEVDRTGERFIISEDATCHFARPGSVTWTLPEGPVGRRRLWLRLRQDWSQADTAGLASAYSVFLNDKQLPLRWARLGEGNSGGAWFALVDAGLIDLDGRPQRLRIDTTVDWCAVQLPHILGQPDRTDGP